MKTKYVIEYVDDEGVCANDGPFFNEVEALNKFNEVLEEWHGCEVRLIKREQIKP